MGAGVKVAEDAAREALLTLAEAFGAEPVGLTAACLSIAREGRLYLDGDKAVYVLAKPVTLADGTVLKSVSLREPVAGDYVAYSKGMGVKVKDGTAEIDTVMMTRRTIRAVAALSDLGADALVERFAVRDIRTLGEVCDALGFFE